MSFEFSEEDHTYALDGTTLPSVTTVLSSLGLYEYGGRYQDVERAMRRGSAIHKACQLSDENNLNIETLTDELRPYLTQWLDFRTTIPFDIISNEVPMYHMGLLYAGTPDRIISREGRVGLLDIKSGAKNENAEALQTVAYADMWNVLNEKDMRIQDRWVVHLTGKGQAKVEPYKDHAEDLAAWKSAFNFYKYLQRRKR